MKAAEVIRWLQQLPEDRKKVILFSVLGIMGSIMVILWLPGVIFSPITLPATVQTLTQKISIPLPSLSITDIATPSTDSPIAQ